MCSTIIILKVNKNLPEVMTGMDEKQNREEME
jgi:hypothetical protein